MAPSHKRALCVAIVFGCVALSLLAAIGCGGGTETNDSVGSGGSDFTQGEWTTVPLAINAILGIESFPAFQPALVGGGEGQAHVVWTETDETEIRIHTSALDLTTGLASPTTPIATLDRTYPFSIVGDGSGSMLLWETREDHVAALYRSPIHGWSAIDSLELNTGSRAMATGNDTIFFVASLWREAESRYAPAAITYSASTGWGPRRIFYSNEVGSAFGMAVAANGKGHAVAAWKQYSGGISEPGSRANIWACQYDPRRGWNEPVRLEEQDAGDAGSPRVVLDEKGNACVVWTQFDGPGEDPDLSSKDIWAARYTPEDGWSEEHRVSSASPGDAYLANVAMGSSGTILVAWRQSERSLYRGGDVTIWHSWYTADDDWTLPREIDPDKRWEAMWEYSPYQPGSLAPVLAIDAYGNALIVWDVSEIGDNIFWSLCPEKGNWSAAQVLDTGVDGASYAPMLLLGDAPMVTVLWRNLEGPFSSPTRSVFATRLQPVQ